ncbi:MAG: nucleoside-diphosphate kinase [Planctomycetota bacterium]|nr:MAG: nucleoside-diphosphate kinase [Planctomycetota bacterium]
MQRTLILAKPDAVQRGLIGRILTRFEDKGMKLVGMKFMQMSDELAAQHYSAHKDKPFYKGLVSFMTSSPIVAFAFEGIGAIEICRKMMGATFGSKAEAGTIRGDFGVSNSFNLIHGSDSPEAAAKELKLFFAAEELIEYEHAAQLWIYDPVEELGRDS